jgi:FdhD protein
MALHGVSGDDKLLLTTGRLTAEVVIKAAINGITVLVCLKGITSARFDLASRLDMTIIGHVGPRRHLCYVGAKYFDAES